MPLAVGAQAAQNEARQRTSPVADPCQGGWSIPVVAAQHGDKEQDALPQLDAAQRLDELRQERNAALALNGGMIPPADRARLVGLSDALNAVAPHSFEAHMARYYTLFPAPAAFDHLEEAVAQNADREELIAPRLVAAARKNNTNELALRAKEMKARGRIAPALYAVANDMLASVEPGAVLIAAGEMDAYPLWVEQFANGKHRDLLVVDHRLLMDPTYRTSIWARANARGAVAGEADFVAALAGATTRPVYLSLALGSTTLAPLKDRLYITGMALRLSDRPVDNIPLLGSRWDRLKKPMDAGPLSKNYLVPGAVLLTHYRANGAETQAARLEHELRSMARALGATNDLVKSGILQH
jgi:hypothetical protein